MNLGSLTPDGNPPDKSARWCPVCCQWIDRQEIRGRRRCPCGAAVVRQTRGERSLPGELRPGVLPEFIDPRDGGSERLSAVPRPTSSASADLADQ